MPCQFEQMMEYGDASDEEAPPSTPPPPQKKGRTRNACLEFFSMLVATEMEDGLK